MSEVNHRRNGRKYSTHKNHSYALASDWEYGDYLTKWNKKMTVKKNRRAEKTELLAEISTIKSIRESDKMEAEIHQAWKELYEQTLWERLFDCFKPWFEIEGSLRDGDFETFAEFMKK